MENELKRFDVKRGLKFILSSNRFPVLTRED